MYKIQSPLHKIQSPVRPKARYLCTPGTDNFRFLQIHILVFRDMTQRNFEAAKNVSHENSVTVISKPYWQS
jgi:hypothetical protein